MANKLVWLRSRVPPEVFASVTEPLRRRLPAEEYERCVEDQDFLAQNRSVAEKMLWYDLARIRKSCVAAGTKLLVMSYPCGEFRRTCHAFALAHRVQMLDPVEVLGAGMVAVVDESDAGYERLNGYGNGVLAAAIAVRLRGTLASLFAPNVETPLEPGPQDALAASASPN